VATILVFFPENQLTKFRASIGVWYFSGRKWRYDFYPVQGSAGMAYRLIPSHFKPWAHPKNWPNSNSHTVTHSLCMQYTVHAPSVLWHFWLGITKRIRSVKVEWWVVICLERGAHGLQMVKLMPLYPKTPSSLASFKTLTGFVFLVPAYPGYSGKAVLKRL